MADTKKLNEANLLKVMQILHAYIGEEINRIDMTEVINDTLSASSTNTYSINKILALVGERLNDEQVAAKIQEAIKDLPTEDTNTTYTLTTNASAENGDAAITFTGSDSTTKDIAIKGEGATTVTTDVDGNVVITSTDTQLTEVPASMITGVIDIEHIPAAAIERCTVVADKDAMKALTTAQVQNGDSVKCADTGYLFLVVDDTKLGTADVEEAFIEFSVGSAASVPWSGVTDKPETFTPSEHVHDVATSDANGFMSSTMVTKLASVEQGAQVNIIESVSVNGSALEVTDKGVELTVPTKISDLTDDNTYLTDTDIQNMWDGIINPTQA